MGKFKIVRIITKVFEKINLFVEYYFPVIGEDFDYKKNDYKKKLF